MSKIYRVALLWLLLGVALPSGVYAQCADTCPNPGGCPAGDTPDQAPILCGNSLTGTTFSNAGATADNFFPASFCGTIENNQWIGFVATAPSMTFVLTPQGGGEGIQGVVYAPNANCTNFTQISNCESPGTATAITLTANNMTVGETYYIMTDGFGGATHSYTIDITNGDVPLVIVPPGPIAGPNEASNGTGCSFQFSVPDLGPGITYNWTVPNGSIISGQGSNVIDVTFNNPGISQITVVAETGCGDSPPSPPHIVAIAPSVPGTEIGTICTGQNSTTNTTYTYNGQTFSSPGSYPVTLTGQAQYGCDSMVTLLIIGLPTAPNVLPQQEVCPGECVNINGTDYCDEGQTIINIPGASFTGCDSLVVIDLVTVGPEADIQASATELDCSGAPITLDGSGSMDADTYEWTGPNGNAGTTASIQITEVGTYTLTVTATLADGSSCSDTETITITSNATNPPAPTITGAASVCANSTETYSITADPAYSTITWTVAPAGTTFTGQGTASISVDWGGTATSVSVTAGNACGDETDTQTITFGSGPTVGAITGNTTICPGDVETYTIPDAGTGVTYAWTATGGTITAGQGSTSVTVDWGAGATSISVTATNSCGNGSQSQTITFGAGPTVGTISGPTTICAGDTETYTVPDAGAGTSYTWNVTGGSILSGQGGTSISVDWTGSTGGTVGLDVMNSCGSASATDLTITVGSAPATPVNMTGNFAVCGSGQQTYAITAATGVDYTWSVTGAASITGASNQASVNVNPNGATSFDVCVVASNSCGNSGTYCETVTVTAAPTASIAGGGAFCAGSGGTVDLNFSLTAGSTPWTVTYGNGATTATVTIYQTDTTITTGAAGTYTISDVQSNGCPGTGNGSATVTENPLPTAAISGGGSICAGSGSTVDLPIALTGTPPFTVVVNIGGVDQAPITINTTTFDLTASTAGTYGITSVTDANMCQNTGDPTMATVTEDTEVTVTNISEDCNATGDAYVITFSISGGDPATYNVTGDAGTLAGTTFTSDPIAAGSPYNFNVNDGANCNTVTVSAPEVICNCATAVGTMDPTLLEICGDGDATATYDNTNENLNPNDALQFILHTGSGLTIDGEVARAAQPTFGFQTSMTYGATYYISAVTGSVNNGTDVDLGESCTMVAQGTPVVWNEAPEATLSGDATLCDGADATLTVTWTGTAPFSFTLSDGTPFTGINASPYTFTYTPTATGSETLTLTDAADANCPATLNGSATVEQLAALTTGAAAVTPDATNTTYTVCFDLMGGQAPYFVDGNPVTGTQFCSTAIPCGDGYSFDVTDSQNCGPVTVAQAQVVCSCTTQAGDLTVTTDPATTCDDGTLSATYDATNETLDGDDVVTFILHNGDGNPILTSATPDFSFGAPLAYGTTYFIAAWVGSDDGTGAVDAADPCLSVSASTPVTWFEAPTFTVSGDATYCAGDQASVTVTITGGVAPYEFTLSTGDVINTGQTSVVVDLASLPSGNTTVTLTAAEDANCPAAALNGTATLMQLDAIVSGAPSSTPNATNTNYTVCFDITGGEAPYFVDGVQITGTQYCSTAIDCGDGYSFEVTDSQNCGPVTVAQAQVACDCTTQVGDIDVTLNPLNTCDDGTLSASYDATNEALDGDDVVDFILHNGDGVPILTSSTPDFTFGAPLVYGTVYYIAARVGNDDGTGSVDSTDPCLSLSDATPVVWNESPTATLSGAAQVCAGETVSFTVDISGGTAPYSIQLLENGTSVIIDNLSGPTHTLDYTASDSLNIELVAVVTDDCIGSASGSAVITLNDAPQATNVQSAPNATNTNYTICFDISGGDATTWTVTGGSGTITGNQFCSDAIDCGTTDYSFTLTDADNCNPQTIAGSFACNCDTQVGAMTGDPVEVCEDVTATFTYDDTNQTFDGNDGLMYVLHDNAGTGIGTVIATGTTPDFDYQAGIDYGVTYYVSAVVGDFDGTEVDLNDPCLSVAAGTPVVFNQLPTATMNVTPQICEGGTGQLTFTVGGQTGTFILTLDDGTTYTVTGDETIDVSPAATTTYTLVSIENAATGCTTQLNESGQLEVNQGSTSGTAQEDLDFCEGQTSTVTLEDLLVGADPGGVWTAAAGNPTGGQFNATDGTFGTGGAPIGTYEFVYTQNNGGTCPDEQTTVTVLITETPTADAGADQLLTCDDTEAQLGGNSSQGANFQYEWVDADNVVVSTERQPILTQPGTYTLTVINTLSGCFAQDEAVIDASLSTPVPFFSVSDVSCFGDEDGFFVIDSIVGGVEPYLCSIDDGPFTQQKVFQNLDAGTYNIVVQDANGCEVTVDLDVTQPDEILLNLVSNVEGEDNVINWGDSIQLTLVSDYPTDSFDIFRWSPPEMFGCDTCNAEWVSPLETTTFGIFVQEGECSAESSLTVTVSRDVPVFMPTAFSPNGEGENDIFFVQADPSVIMEVVQFQIFDRWGEATFLRSDFLPNDPSFGWDGSLRGQDLDPGVFVWMVEVRLVDGTTRMLAGDVALLR